jgi:hypothetical protein
MRGYLIELDVNDSTISAVSFTENEVYRVQQESKKRQCTVIFIECVTVCRCFCL